VLRTRTGARSARTGPRPVLPACGGRLLPELAGDAGTVVVVAEPVR
jgi:hypothetical protein